MARVNFDQSAFERDLRFATARLRRAVTPAMTAASERLADQIRQEAPVDTGKLQASVKVGPVRRRKRSIVQDVSIGSDDDRYIVAHVEYGTAHEPPDGFIRRAADAEEAAMIRIISDALGASIE